MTTTAMCRQQLHSKILIGALILLPFFTNAQEWEKIGGQATTQNAGTTEFAVALNGDMYVGWENTAIGGNLCVRKYDGSKSWIDVGKPGVSISRIHALSMVVDNNNTPYVAYADLKLGDKAMVKSFDGNEWRILGKEALSVGVTNNTFLAVDKNNVLYVAFTDLNTRKISVMKWDGTNWSEFASPFSDGTGDTPKLVFDNNGVMHIVFIDTAIGRRCTVKKFVNGKWEMVGKTTVSDKEAQFVSLSFDSGNEAYVGYKDAFFGGKLLVKKLENNEWKLLSPVFTSSANNYFSMVVNTLPYAVFSNTNDGKIISKKFDGTNWVAAASTDEAAGKGSRSQLYADKQYNYLLTKEDGFYGAYTVKRQKVK